MTVSILVVDDESDVAELFRQRFRREVRQGTYAMHFANSGEEALGKLADGIEPTLVVTLSDINMPGMDGLQLLGEIKQRFPDLPVMMVTAYGDDERRRKASHLGALDFLTKPVDFDRLKERCVSSRPRRTDRASLHPSANVCLRVGPLNRWRGRERQLRVDLSRPIVAARTAGIGAPRPSPCVPGSAEAIEEQAAVTAWCPDPSLSATQLPARCRAEGASSCDGAGQRVDPKRLRLGILQRDYLGFC